MVYLKSQTSADLIRKNFGNNAVKCGENLHGQLRLNATFVDQVIKGVCQRQAKASVGSAPVSNSMVDLPNRNTKYLLPR
jgi:hypothetical protein